MKKHETNEKALYNNGLSSCYPPDKSIHFRHEYVRRMKITRPKQAKTQLKAKLEYVFKVVQPKRERLKL